MMNGALRIKILIGVAVAVGGYTFLAPSDGPTVEASKEDGAIRSAVRTRAVHPAEARGQRAMHALYLLAHRVSTNASAGTLFAVHSWYTAPAPLPAPPSPPPMSAAEAAALQVPSAPPLPFSYMGSYMPAGSDPVFFLTQGDRVYDVRVGDTLDNTYTVDALSNGRLVMTYKPLKIQQQLSVGASP